VRRKAADPLASGRLGAPGKCRRDLADDRCGPSSGPGPTIPAEIAPQFDRNVAGVIHSDFERGFIKSETVSYDDLVASGSVPAACERGLYRMEGKEYVVADGDVLLFKFNV